MKSLTFELHELFNKQKRFYFPFEQEKKEIPENGIYILFENGEKFGDWDRIVRIGTHKTGERLKERLKQHFIIENKNGSIFRKNIGRCILNNEESSYLKLWELKITPKTEKENFFKKQLEKRISIYIQTNFSFCVFQVDTKEERLFWESKIISTLAKSKELFPSKKWLGNHSPKEKIKSSGLWQVSELNKDIMTEQEFMELRNKLLLQKNKFISF